MKDVISECRNTESMNCHKDEVQKLMIYLLRSKRFEYNREITAIGQTFSLGNAEKEQCFIYLYRTFDFSSWGTLDFAELI